MIRRKYSKYSKELIYLRYIYSLPFITLSKLCNDYNLAAKIKYNKECILFSHKVDEEIQSVKSFCVELYNFLCITPQNTKQYKTKMLLFIDKSPINLFKNSINAKVWRKEFDKIDLEFLREEHQNLFEMYQLINVEI